MNWENKKTVMKGNMGEEIINRYLESENFVIYKPITDGPHAFDRLAIRDKEQVIIAEIKTKAHRNYYPDTGIDIRHYQEYNNISNKHNLPVFLFFVDEMEKEIYGNWLSELEKPRIIEHKGKIINYPLQYNGIIYFPLECMRAVGILTEEESQILKQYSERNYDYIF